MEESVRRVGPWQVLARLGVGGMGTVYLGENSDGIRAAIKVVAANLAADPAFRSRFKREVEVCRQVAGHQIAELIDSDVNADRPWLAIRYVEGPTLAEAIRQQGPLRGEALRGFAVAVAEALRQIHSAGVTHRDLKPSNIILTPSSPVIIDFGIAGAADATSLTSTGMTMGSAGWMAPEQVLGRPTSPATDVFAWAAVVVFAATGRSPFGEGRPEALAYRVVHGEADLSGVDGTLLPLLRVALADDPAKRPTVTELLWSLGGKDAVADSATVIAGTWAGQAHTLVARGADPVPVRSSRRSSWPRPSTLGVATAAVVAIFVAGVVWMTNGREPDTSADAATQAGEGSAQLLESGEQEATSSDPISTTTTSLATTTSAAPTTTTTTTPPRRPVRDFDYQNMTYPRGCEDDGGPMRVDDGRWTAAEGPEYGALELVYVDFADVTGDGIEDSIVDLTCTFGASSSNHRTLVMESDGQELVQVGQSLAGSGRAEGGEIVIELPYYLEDDPRCCPSMLERGYWTFHNGGWDLRDTVIDYADTSRDWGE